MCWFLSFLFVRPSIKEFNLFAFEFERLVKLKKQPNLIVLTLENCVGYGRIKIYVGYCSTKLEDFFFAKPSSRILVSASSIFTKFPSNKCVSSLDRPVFPRFVCVEIFQKKGLIADLF